MTYYYITCSYNTLIMWIWYIMVTMQSRLDTHHTAPSRHVTLQYIGSYQYSQSQYETSVPKVITENYERYKLV